MSTKNHPNRGILADKNVYENSWKVSTKIHQYTFLESPQKCIKAFEKLIFVLSPNEYLGRLEGKIRKSLC